MSCSAAYIVSGGTCLKSIGAGPLWCAQSIHITGILILHDDTFAGFGVQALATGQGALGSLAQFSQTFGVDLEEIEQAAGNIVS